MGFSWKRFKLRFFGDVAVDQTVSEQVKHTINVKYVVDDKPGPTTGGDPKYNGFNKDLAPSIKFAFRSGTKNYFMLNHELNIPIMRANQSLEIWRELEYGLSPAIIEATMDTLRSEAKKAKTLVDLQEAVFLYTSRTKERVANTNSYTLALKLATIRYFDEEEDITGYDWAYNAEKLKYWSENHDIKDFFLLLPLNHFISSSEGLEANFLNILKTEILVAKSHLVNLLSSVESNEVEKNIASSLTTQIETLELLMNWSKKESSNSIST